MPSDTISHLNRSVFLVTHSHVWHPKWCWELLRAFSEERRGQSPALAGVASHEVLRETPGPASAPHGQGQHRVGQQNPRFPLRVQREQAWSCPAGMGQGGQGEPPCGGHARNSGHPCVVLSVHRAFLWLGGVLWGRRRGADGELMLIYSLLDISHPERSLCLHPRLQRWDGGQSSPFMAPALIFQMLSSNVLSRREFTAAPSTSCPSVLLEDLALGSSGLGQRFPLWPYL